MIGYPSISEAGAGLGPMLGGTPLAVADAEGMDGKALFYFGNAAVDQLRDSGWFVGQFVPSAQGVRHQTSVELKWGIHKDGEKRSRPWATRHATTISVLIKGALRVTFYGETPQVVTLEKEGDYVVFTPDAVHFWEAFGDTLVLSVRFPTKPKSPAGA